MNRILLILAIAVLGLLGGCVTFENRLACALDGDEAFFISKYGQFGITSTITERDVPHICGK